MRKGLILIAALGNVALLMSCGSDVKREPGKIYMPDMAYSRALETYADHSNLAEKGINYNARPVTGTVSRSDDYVFHIPKDAPGEETNYNASAAVTNPVQMLTDAELEETKRLYNIQCGICHGTKLDGNGPLYKGGDGPYPAKPATLVGDTKYEEMSEGMMFYSIAYGRNLMGGYSAQLSARQRWNIVHYIKMEQGKKTNGKVPAPSADSAAVSNAVAAN